MEKEGTLLRLQEDPLRSLRAVRFASKFEFRMSECMKEVIQSEPVRNFLLTKTTNERILTETKKILSLSPLSKALSGCHSLLDLGLFQCIFPMAAEVPGNFWEMHSSAILHCIQAVGSMEDKKVSQNSLLLCSLLYPFYQANGYVYPNGASHDFPFTREHMKETWKYPTKQASEVLDILEAAVLLCKARLQPWTSDLQKECGRCLRKTREKWIHSIQIAQILASFQAKESDRTQVKVEFENLQKCISLAGLDGSSDSLTAWDMPLHFTVGSILYIWSLLTIVRREKN